MTNPVRADSSNAWGGESLAQGGDGGIAMLPEGAGTGGYLFCGNGGRADGFGGNGASATAGPPPQANQAAIALAAPGVMRPPRRRKLPI